MPRARPLLALVVLAACGGPAVTAPTPPAPAPTARAAPAGPAPAIRGHQGDVALFTHDGKQVRLGDYGARVTVVALWASFCAPCLQELPLISKLHHALAGEPDVAVLAIGLDDARDPAARATIDRALAGAELEMPMLYDGGEAIARLAPPDADGAPQIVLPMRVIIDADFQLHRDFGFDPGQSEAEFVAEVRRLIDVARAGRLATLPAATSPTSPAKATLAPGDHIKLKIDKLDADQLAIFLPQLRAQLTTYFPQLDEAAIRAILVRAETAARTGGDLELEIPPPRD